MTIQREKSSPLLLITGLFAVFIVTVLVLTVFCVPQFYGQPDKAGEFGDMFGAPNALFSGLAFLGVVYAILLQRQELQLQRQELEETRKELRGQREQFEIQSETFRLQTFESTFFQMLSTHHQIVTNMLFDRSGPRKGRECFELFRQLIEGSARDTGKAFERLSMDDMKSAYDRVYPSLQPVVGHYFRHLYNVVKFVDQSGIENKRLYTNLIRAQLSSLEVLLLFYNCNSEVVPASKSTLRDTLY